MKQFRFLCIFSALLFCIAGNVFAAQISWNPKEFMGVDEIKPGMVGYGKTVFEGTRIDKFGVEVVGVLRKVDFGFDMILIKVTSGPVVDRKLQTVEGMSGSPIYINNRLIGAYAYGWEFQQEPIAGVTPIAAMLDCAKSDLSAPLVTAGMSLGKHAMRVGGKLITRVSVTASRSDAERLKEKNDPSTMVLAPAASPLFVSGVSDMAMKPLEEYFRQYNLRVVPGPGGMPGPPTKLEAGSSVAVPLVEGDADMSAIGTVTYVKGDTVLAFGHPFFGLGKTNLPMSTAYVQGILNSSSKSFKLASPVAQVGTIQFDRQFAVGGEIGKKPTMLPVTLHLTDASRKLDKLFFARMVDDPIFTPFLLYTSILFNGASQLADMSVAQGIYKAHATLSTDKLGDIEQDISFVQLGQFPPRQPSNSPLADFMQLTDIMMTNQFERVRITAAKVDVDYSPDLNVALIENVIPDRVVARPGETVNFTVKIRPYGKPLETKQVSLVIPQTVAEPMMAVVVAGGAENRALRQLLTPVPTPDDGIQGIVRFLTSDPPAKTIFSAEIFPSPSYTYHGNTLKELPLPFIDFLNFGNVVGVQGSDDSGDGGLGGNIHPSIYNFSQEVPYTLYGGKIMQLAIDLPQQKTVQGAGPKGTGPLLSSSMTSAPPRPEDGGANSPDSSSANDDESLSFWMTPAQRAHEKAIVNSLQSQPYGMTTTLRIPTLHYDNSAGQLPLSLLMRNSSLIQSAEGDAPVPPVPSDEPDDAAEGKPVKKDEAEAADSETTITEDKPDTGSPEEAEKQDEQPSIQTGLLTRSRLSWGITGRKDFLRGTHIGTTVTAKGALELMPNVRTVYQTNDMLPWKIVTTSNGSYVAGWKSNKVLRIAEDGKSEIIFPKRAEEANDTECVTALSSDADGNLLVGTWPDQRVRLIAPDGNIIRDWSLSATIWDIAVTSEGKRFAAATGGTLYLLKDDPIIPLQAAANVLDKSVTSLSPGPNGDIYFATSPRGKVYRLAANGNLTSVYESKDSVSSLAVDMNGNVYVGTSPSCTVVRVSPDGTISKIMNGFGTMNRHVLSLKLSGDSLYAATGPAGGIYRIKQPAAADPDVTTIFARQDLRTDSVINDVNASVGIESVMVNSLSVTPDGVVLAAASSPGQILRLEPREKGSFISAVLFAPAVSQWGQLAIFQDPMEIDVKRVHVAVRSGRTAWPDATWSEWAALQDNDLINSPAATYAQIRIDLAQDEVASPSVNAIRAYYLPANRTPMLKLVEPATGAFWMGKKEVRWMGKDPDEDELIYTVFVSPDAGKTWGQLISDSPDEKKPAEAPAAALPAPAPPPANTVAPPKSKGRKPSKEKKQELVVQAPPPAPTPPAPPKPPAMPMRETNSNSFPWDTKTSKDGQYIVKVIASDKYARPTDSRSTEVFSGSFTIDNTPPTATLKDKAARWDEVQQFLIVDNLTPIVGGKFRIDDGQWIAITADDGLFDSTREMVSLRLPDGPPTLSDGDHKLQIFATDSAVNKLDKTITLTVGTPAPEAAAK